MTTLIQTVHPNHIALHAEKQVSCSAEVGALASEFKKSATESKPKPNSFKCKCIDNI